MDCRVVLPSGKTARLKNLNPTWNVADLVAQLEGRGFMTNEEIDALVAAGLNLSEPIPSELNLDRATFMPTEEQKHQKRSSGLKRRSQTNEHPDVEEATPPIKSKPSGGGLKKRTTSRIGKKRPSNPSPEPAPPPLKAVEKPVSILNMNSYIFPLKCSTNGRDWYATLASSESPRKQAPVRKFQPQKAKSNYGTIHLVLDDSGSMDGPKDFQQKKGAKAFLDSRSPSDHIHLTVLDGRLDEYGPPSVIKRSVDRVTTDGGTPISGRFNRLRNEVNSGGKGAGSDIIVFFTDGESTDGDPRPAAMALKAMGVRIICIGCGSADEHVLRAMASSPGDYHHASGAGQILQAFQAVARSIGQEASSQHAKTQTSRGNGAKAAQIGSDSGTGPSLLGTTGSASTHIGVNEGFDVILDFDCHFCHNKQRTSCPLCGQAQCMGAGLATSDPKEIEMNCCSCRETFLVTLSESAHQSVLRGGGKKG